MRVQVPDTATPLWGEPSPRGGRPEKCIPRGWILLAFPLSAQAAPYPRPPEEGGTSECLGGSEPPPAGAEEEPGREMSPGRRLQGSQGAGPAS